MKQCIVTACTQSFPICVPIPDYKVEVKTLDTVEDLSFPGTMSRTKVTNDRLEAVLLHALEMSSHPPRFQRVLRIFWGPMSLFA